MSFSGDSSTDTSPAAIGDTPPPFRQFRSSSISLSAFVSTTTDPQPQDANYWLPITTSINGNAYSAAFHILCSGIGIHGLVLPVAFTALGWYAIKFFGVKFTKKYKYQYILNIFVSLVVQDMGCYMLECSIHMATLHNLLAGATP